MPSYKYTITVIGGTWNGYTFTKFSQYETDVIVSSIKNNYNLDCNVEKIKLY